MQVGRYRFVDRLAVGGMAEVFVAIAQGSEGFEKPVVIKRLLPQLAAIPRFRQMFLDEARITANLQHGNIVGVIDMGSMDGLPFLALEYVDGRDLRTVHFRAVDKGRAIPQGLVTYVAIEVCRALDYAHRKSDDDNKPLNIVHRDINPANIFISHEGAVKVGDFGLAKARDNLEQSEVGLIKGKFSYMSPEQARGVPVDHRSDIFSLGATLYEITCGKLPFTAGNDMEVLKLVREAVPTPPSELIPDYDEDMEAIILKAMQRDPDQRYSTAAEMRDHLARHLQKLGSPGERQLTDYLNSLFGQNRRTQSHLVRLPSAESLPPMMTSITRRSDGLAEFSRATSTKGPSTGPHRLGGREDATATLPALSLEKRGGRRTLLGVVVGLLLLLGATAALLLLRKPETASLKVLSKPIGAEVALDGRFTGQRTPALLLDLQTGRDYVVSVRHKDGKPTERRFNFHEAGNYSHSFNLAPGGEVLSLESRPTAVDVLVDGELRGQTPLKVTLTLGKHTIELRKAGYHSKMLQHRANRDKARLMIRLDRKTSEATKKKKKKRPSRRNPFDTTGKVSGYLEVATQQRAKIYLNGRFVGRTPGFRMKLPIGRYAITVKPLDTNIVHKALIDIVAKRTHRLRLTPPSR